MNSLERTLTPEEHALYRTDSRWILCTAASGPAGVAVGGAIASSLIAEGPLRAALPVMATAALGAGLFRVLLIGAQIRVTKIVVSNLRVIHAGGVLSRRSIEMNRDRVESIVIDQSRTGGLLDLGTVIVRGVGAGLERVANVIAPMEFRRQVRFE